MQTEPLKFKAAADAVVAEAQADVVIFSGSIAYPGSQRLQQTFRRRAPKRKKLLVVLTTLGGFPDQGYRIARSIQSNYERVVVWVPNYCKSAGTLVCVGAHELVMSDSAELGPLDMQILKRDEIEEFGSGLDMIQALTFAEGRAVSAFSDALRKIHELGLSSKLAGDMASALARGMYAEIFSQIDPVRLGEVSRAMRVGEEYGNRLAARGNNLKPQSIERLVARYPSHTFVIDRDEAGELFRHVTGPTAAQAALAEVLAPGLLQDTGFNPVVQWIEEVPAYLEAVEALKAQAGSTQPNATQAPAPASVTPQAAANSPQAGADGTQNARPLTGAVPAPTASASTSAQA